MVKSIRSQAIAIIRANFSIYEMCSLTGADYRTMEAIYTGRRVLPLSMAFSVLEFMGYSVSFVRK